MIKNCNTIDSKHPKIATKLNMITTLYLPEPIRLPPKIEPIAIPRTEALARMVVWLSPHGICLEMAGTAYPVDASAAPKFELLRPHMMASSTR
jgi:hypothetical protein